MQQTLAAADDGASAIGSGIAIIAVLWVVFVIIGWWKIFDKADEAGWKSLIPIYNMYTMLRIVGRPGWMVLGFLVPFVNVILYIIVMGDLAKSFGRGIGTVLGLIFFSPVFAMILGFGRATYVGPWAEMNQRYRSVRTERRSGRPSLGPQPRAGERSSPFHRRGRAVAQSATTRRSILVSVRLTPAPARSHLTNASRPSAP